MTTEPTIGATLAFRPDEIRRYSSDEADFANFHTFYAVMLNSVERFPKGNVSPKCKPLGVACMQMACWGDSDFPSWGWVHLDPDAKLLIGYDLAAMDVERDEWIYMAIESPGKFNPEKEEL